MRRSHLAWVAAGGAAALLVAWRRYRWPCPSWLAPSLENPYFEAFAGAETLLERAGVAPSMCVLDAGCGPGRLTIPAARRVGANGTVVALDVQPAMLERLERRLEREGIHHVETLQSSLGEGRLPNDKFDVAFLVTVLGEVPDPERALAELYAAIKPGGLLSVTEVIPDPHFQTQARVRALAEAAGFRVGLTFSRIVAFTMHLTKPS